MDQLLQHLLNGLLLGSTYSLLGIGLTLVFGLMNVVNFAHGEFYTLGAYAAFAALVGLSVNFFLAHPARHRGRRAGGGRLRAAAAPAAARGQSIDTTMLVMIGALDRDAERASCSPGAGWPRACPRPSRPRRVVLGPVSVAPLRIFVFVVSVLLIVGAHLLLARTGSAARCAPPSRTGRPPPSWA